MDWEDASTISNQPETESSKIPKPSLPKKAKDYKTVTEPLRLCKSQSLISQIQAFQFELNFSQQVPQWVHLGPPLRSFRDVFFPFFPFVE